MLECFLPVGLNAEIIVEIKLFLSIGRRVKVNKYHLHNKYTYNTKYNTINVNGLRGFMFIFG